MQATEIAEKLLPMYLGVEFKYDKDYSYVSEKRQLELLKLHRGYEKSRATLGRWKARLEEEGFIRRIQRFKRHPVFGMVFNSTAVYITIKGLYWLRRAGHNVTSKIYRAIIRMKKINPAPPPKIPNKIFRSSKPEPETLGGLFKNLGLTDLCEFDKRGT